MVRAGRSKARLVEWSADHSVKYSETLYVNERACVRTLVCAHMHAGLPLTRSSDLQTSWSTAGAWEGKAARRKSCQKLQRKTDGGGEDQHRAEVRPGPEVGEGCFRSVTGVDATGWTCPALDKLHRTGGIIPSRGTGKRARTHTHSGSHTGWRMAAPPAPQRFFGLGSGPRSPCLSPAPLVFSYRLQLCSGPACPADQTSHCLLVSSLGSPRSSSWVSLCPHSLGPQESRGASEPALGSSPLLPSLHRRGFSMSSRAQDAWGGRVAPASQIHMWKF